jgi:hypothetical protein
MLDGLVVLTRESDSFLATFITLSLLPTSSSFVVDNSSRPVMNTLFLWVATKVGELWPIDWMKLG